MITGRIFEIAADRIEWRKDGMTLKDIPMWDSPVLIAPRTAVQFVRESTVQQKEGGK